MQSFTKESCDDLSLICRNIETLLKENIDGQLMYSQLIFLGDNIKKFLDNPIIKNSGILI